MYMVCIVAIHATLGGCVYWSFFGKNIHINNITGKNMHTGGTEFYVDLQVPAVANSLMQRI